jgi:LPXTG-motif cell wall-anchored protein
MTLRSLKHSSMRTLMSGLVLTALLGANALAQSASQSRPHSLGAPEIDPSIAAAGVTLLAGGTVLLTGRRRKKTQ